MLGVQKNILAVAIAEKRELGVHFIELLEERDIPMDILI